MQNTGRVAIAAALNRGSGPYQTMGVRALSPLIGAEIEGLDLRLPLSDEAMAELRRALLEHHVLVFRDQLISEEEHDQIARLLGPLYEREGRRVTLPDGPPVNTTEVVDQWRALETYRLPPPALGVLHVSRLPRLGAGGDMLFANMHLALELLSEPLQALLAGFSAVHSADPAVQDPSNLTAEHPVVLQHPETGRPYLYVNRKHTSHITQLDRRQSRATLDMLFRHLETHQVLTCRVRWTPNTLVIWDNRCTQQLILQDFRPGCLSGRLVLVGD